MSLDKKAVVFDIIEALEENPGKDLWVSVLFCSGGMIFSEASEFLDYLKKNPKIELPSGFEVDDFEVVYPFKQAVSIMKSNIATLKMRIKNAVDYIKKVNSEKRLVEMPSRSGGYLGHISKLKPDKALNEFDKIFPVENVFYYSPSKVICLEAPNYFLYTRGLAFNIYLKYKEENPSATGKDFKNYMDGAKTLEGAKKKAIKEYERIKANAEKSESILKNL